MKNMANYESLGMDVLEGHCKTYYARKKGKAHVDNGSVCQDYCLVENIGRDIQVVCVADGHGGEAYTKSDKGSYYACTVFVDLIRAIKQNKEKSANSGLWLNVLNTSDFKKKYIQMWKESVIKDYRKENENCNESTQDIVKKYGTTFLFVVYCGDYYAVGQLGDGAILLTNEYDQSQLFKRHKVKTTSATSSLASNRAEYAFVIDIFETKYFSSILLSTDGVYDKLDTDDSFSLYEKDLSSQIQTEGELKQPFRVQGIDVSDISRDDCTIAIIKTEKKADPFISEGLGQTGYENIRFIRYTRGIVIYEGEKQGKKVEIHIVDTSVRELDIKVKSVALFKSEQVFTIDKKMQAYIYEIPKNCRRVAELVDSGEHLEKRYWFNENEINVDEEALNGGVYSNEYWLRFYEQVLAFEDELRSINVSLNDFFNECVFVTDDNKLVVLSDVLMEGKEVVNTDVIKRLLSRFGIIGRLSCGKISIPLFETATQGQSIAMLHIASERKVLCKVIYNAEKKILGLWNATDSAWNLENEKRKEIPVQGVIRLNRDHVFYVKPDGKAKIPDAEFVDGYARYQVKVLRR